MSLCFTAALHSGVEGITLQSSCFELESTVGHRDGRGAREVNPPRICKGEIPGRARKECRIGFHPALLLYIELGPNMPFPGVLFREDAPVVCAGGDPFVAQKRDV